MSRPLSPRRRSSPGILSGPQENRRLSRARSLLLTASLLVLGPGLASPADPTSPTEDSRSRVQGRNTSGSSGLLGMDFHENSGAVGWGEDMEMRSTDRSREVVAALPSGLALVLSERQATLSLVGTPNVSAYAHAEASAEGTGSARLHFDSPGILRDLQDRFGDLPEWTGSASFSAQGSADLEVDRFQTATGIEKRSRGILVAVPVASTGLRFFGGAREVEEYVVASVQGFHYQASAQGSVHAEASSQGAGLDGHTSFQDAASHTTSGNLATPGVGFQRSWKYTVAVVGLGYRGEHGGFHVLADVDWSGATADRDGFLDLGVLRQLKLPGNLGDLEVGGDFQVGGFSAGANLKLLSFSGYAIGGEVDLFVNQEFSGVDIGLSYRGQVRGLMADQNAALEVSFLATRTKRLSLVAGVRVLSSYTPEVSYHRDHTQEYTESFSGSSYGGLGEVQASGNASAAFTGGVRVDEREQVRHKVLYYPGLRLDLLDSDVSVGGGLIVDDRGEVDGGHGSVAWEVIPDQLQLGASLQKSESLGNAGGVNMQVLF